MHPPRNRIGSRTGARRRRLRHRGPTRVSAASWKTDVSMSAISASRRAGRVGRSGGADRTQCRGRPVRADRTQCQGTSPVHDGGYGGVERTQCRGGRHGHDGGYGADRSQHLGGRVGGVARRAAACSAWATVASPRRGPQAGLPGGRSDRADRSQFRGASLFRAGRSVRTDRTQYAGGLPGRADRTRCRGAVEKGRAGRRARCHADVLTANSCQNRRRTSAPISAP